MRDALGRIQTVLVLGGGSDIARATVRALLDDGPLTVVLAARTPDSLDTADLEARGATVERIAFDARATDEHGPVFDRAFSRPQDVDLVLVAFGLLGEQARDERDASAAVAIADVNFTGAVSAITHAVERLRAQGHGTVVVLSSVAAVRARRSNFVYGAGKAGLDAFAQGVQQMLAGEPVRLMIVRPGFVHTSMTRHLPPAPLSVSAEEVAEAIVRGLRRRRRIVWVPGRLLWAAAALRVLPERLVRRL